MNIEKTLFIPAFSSFPELVGYSVMLVPIIIYGNVLYGHETKTVRVLLNQTQLSQRHRTPNQEHIP
jgi:hypothetical protein